MLDIEHSRHPRSLARHSIARSLGVAEGPGSRCVLCGLSPFATAGTASKAFGVGFSDWALCDDPTAPELCTGCAALMAGKPGSTPPPLRTRSLAVIDGELSLPDHATMWSLITEPPEGLTVLSWAVSKQRHHVLNAEEFQVPRLAVGSDHGTIRIDPTADSALINALLVLRSSDATGKPWFTRDEVVAGSYRPQRIAIAAATWESAEEVCAARRGSLAFALYAHHAPSLPDFHPDQGATMLDPIDEQAAALLASLALESPVRQENGIDFWRTLFARRVVRHAGRPLSEAVSRLMTDLAVPASSRGAQEAVGILAELPAEQSQAITRSWRTRTSLVVALAFDRLQTARAEKQAKGKTTEPTPLQEQTQ